LALAHQEGLSIHDAQSRILGYHYGQIGQQLMKNWDLSLTCYQRTPLQATENRTETALLHLAHGYAYCHFIDKQCSPEALIQPQIWQILNISVEQVEAPIHTALATSAEMEKVILR
jgi:hypothetical protein